MPSMPATAAKFVGWTPPFALPALAWFTAPADLPRWAGMWLIACTMYAGLKWLSWWDARSIRVPVWRHAAYLFAWPGMDAPTFLGNSSRCRSPTSREWLAAAIKLGCGAALVWFLAPRVGRDNDWLFGWVAMVGLILLLHCGLFHLLSCAWRAIGVDARPLMNSPLLATGVADFWGRRWNIAFRDLTHRFVFLPLTKRLGPRWALTVGFVISGLIHELAITIPVGSGYGGPTVFFTIQAAALFVERSAWGRRFGLGRGVVGWSFAAVTLIGPVGLLFPTAFVTEIIVPFCRFIGAG